MGFVKDDTRQLHAAMLRPRATSTSEHTEERRRDLLFGRRPSGANVAGNAESEHYESENNAAVDNLRNHVSDMRDVSSTTRQCPL